MERKTTEEFRKDLKDFDTCMLVTRDGPHLRSRPMAPKFEERDGTLRFLTSKKTHKIDEVRDEPQANAVFSDDDDTFISVSGRVRLSDDPAVVDDLWSAAAAPWFEDGKSEAVALIMEPEIAEYWDNSDNRLKAGWEMVKGTLTGETPDVGAHGKLDL
ncbi:pyridoxamine 5'-phosphate oxidase family protein [Aquibium sp. A9E412]|uniref:pyridoxamine 5'-phosphate oxidase family protein n=1 Tax=Aquibium sp. A9E412 TaxID=2976767 RepID=UPI0025B0974D|nr:pyridoxamine 5'-phosphate oxidase family protein [Aquibium sp. A9E412]MDN2567531.1 pyridoxamine 5'-phosphate oxidase family protein [Aquibium sp. A9E412]